MTMPFAFTPAGRQPFLLSQEVIPEIVGSISEWIPSFIIFYLALKKYKLISSWSKINSISKSFATFLVNDLETRN